MLLPFAAAAGLLAVAAFVDQQRWLASLPLVPSWQAAAIADGVLVVVGSVVVRFAAGRGMGARQDVNDDRRLARGRGSCARESTRELNVDALCPELGESDVQDARMVRTIA